MPPRNTTDSGFPKRTSAEFVTRPWMVNPIFPSKSSLLRLAIAGCISANLSTNFLYAKSTASSSRSESPAS